MGMIIIFLWAMYVLVVLVVIGLVSKFITKKLLVKVIIVIFALLLATYDIIFTNIFGAYYCVKDPNPKTFIKQKIDNPISIYWEDNVYPGYTQKDSVAMIEKYLDGIHLNTIAINDKNGMIHVYRATKEDWKATNVLTKGSGQRYYDTRQIEARSILKRGKVYSKSSMPLMNYTVTFNEVKLPWIVKKFLYSDEIKIIDNKRNELIGYSRRYMHFHYHILPDLARGNQYYVQESMCGDSLQYYFSDKLFYNHIHMGVRTIDLNEKLYKKYNKGK